MQGLQQAYVSEFFPCISSMYGGVILKALKIINNKHNQRMYTYIYI